MKIRDGFVSNSSSASFVIKKEFLSPFQIKGLLGLKDYKWTAGDAECFSDGWTISEEDDCISGSTFMDNGAMHQLFARLNIDLNHVEWSGSD